MLIDFISCIISIDTDAQIRLKTCWSQRMLNVWESEADIYSIKLLMQQKK